MTRRDLSQRDASDHAASELEYVIRSEDHRAKPSVPTVSAQKAMQEDRVFEVSSDRDITRVLFISYNTDLLNPIQQSLDGYVNISDLFDEVHILILRQGIPPKNPVLRVADNVWLYTATAKSWWGIPAAGMEMIEQQLEFAGGFRADLLVARDPFESAIVANKLARKHGRPTQLHIIDDYTTADFTRRNKGNFWRLFLPRFTIPKFFSVRTLTNTMKKRLQKQFTITDLEVLPRYQNYVAMIDARIRIDLKQKYKPHIFFMVFVGRLDYKSSFHKMLDAVKELLRNPRLALIVLGDGPSKDEFEKRARMYGIEGQVIFETRVKDILPYLKSANLLLVGDSDFESEEVVLEGAAAGIPMVMSHTDKRRDIFVHGESTFFCDLDDQENLSSSIEALLDDIDLRQQFSLKGQDIIRREFHHSFSHYLSAYRSSIEQAFFVESENEEDAEGEV